MEENREDKPQVPGPEPGDSFSGCVHAQFLEIFFFVIAIVFAAMITNATMRMIVIGAGFITGVYFGVGWLRKAVIKQEVGLFSRESGFYWLLLSLGCALAMFIFDRLLYE